MKIAQFRIFNDLDININLYELIYWSIFFFFIEYIFPILIDPLGLSVEILGYESDDLVEVLIFMLIPFLIIYYGDVMSGFHYILALLLYGLITAPVSGFLIHHLFYDILGVLFLLAFIDELIESQIDNEGDYMDDSEDFSDNYFHKI